MGSSAGGAVAPGRAAGGDAGFAAAVEAGAASPRAAPVDAVPPPQPATSASRAAPRIAAKGRAGTIDALMAATIALRLRPVKRARLALAGGVCSVSSRGGRESTAADV